MEKIMGEGPNPKGLCLCGCGRTTAIARQGSRRTGDVAGTHVRFVSGHHRRGIQHGERAKKLIAEANKKRYAEVGHPMAGRHHSEDTKKKISAKKLGPKHWNWTGGRFVTSSGYVSVYVGYGHPMAQKSKPHVLEHRLVMAEHLGRYLLPTESVHHRNGDKQDNRIENLELVDVDVHTTRRTAAIYRAAVQGCLARGLTVVETATELHLSPETVEVYAKE